MYRFHCGCEAGETVRSGRLKPWTSLLEAAGRLIFGVGFLIAALFMATSPVTESLRLQSVGEQRVCLQSSSVDLARPRTRSHGNSL